MTDPSLRPQVSVLIPCWNAAASIDRALRSVLDGATVAVECVVVDDASPDGTADVVQAIADVDPRVVLVRAPVNGGVSVARNLGLPLLKGEWVTFLDSDDRLLPGAIDALHRAALETDALAVVGQRIWSDGVDTWVTKSYDRPDIREPGRKSLVRNPGLMYYASGTGKLFHRSIIEGLTFEGRVLGDQPWTLRALLRAGDRIEVIGDTVYEWTRPRPGHEFTTITETKRGSAAVAAEAVVVAIGAWRQVAAEADLQLPDETSRRIVCAGYFDRLVRADFGGPVRRALDARDGGTRRLFEAIAEFITAAPTDVVAGSGALAGSVFRPVLDYWDRVPAPARSVFWAMLRPLLVPGTPFRAELTQTRRGRLAIWPLQALPGRSGTVTASVLLRVLALGRRVYLFARRRPGSVVANPNREG